MPTASRSRGKTATETGRAAGRRAHRLTALGAHLARPRVTISGWTLLLLCFALAIGGLAIFILRQRWATSQSWPWLLLIVGMVIAAISLHRLDAWLPRRPGSGHPAAANPQWRRRRGRGLLIAASVVIAVLVLHLWPDYTKWQGTPFLWLLAIALVLVGAWLIGAVGESSGRATSSLAWWPATRRSRWLEGVAFLLILALAVFLRTYRLDAIPPAIYVDETNAGLNALGVLEGNGVSPFATGWYETPNGYIYYMAAIFRFLGANWLSLKLVSLIPAILTVPAVYLLGRELFGPSAGLMAMLLMAVSRWHLTMSRWGWNETAPPLFEVLTFYFLFRGLRNRRSLEYALSGLIAGLVVYTYLSSRLVIATLVLYVVYWFLSDPEGIRSSLGRSWQGILILAAAAIIAVAPIGVTYVRNPFSFANRSSEINVFREMQDQGKPQLLFENIANTLKSFHQTGDHVGRQNLPGEPMLDPFTGLFFAVGVAYALLGLRDHRHVLLLLWLVLGLAGDFLSSHLDSPDTYRSMTALPAAVMLAADVLDRFARAIYQYFREQPFTVRRVLVPGIVSGGAVLVVLAGATAWESNVYFGRQASSAAVLGAFNQMETSAARETIAALQAGKTVYLSPTFSEFSPLRFLVYGVYKSQYGTNTLDAPPYHLLQPEVSLPLPPDGHDALVLLDNTYWPLRDFILSYYPDATIELAQASDGPPIYMRIEVPKTAIAALGGLDEHITYADGTSADRNAENIGIDPSLPEPSKVSWSGALRLEEGGEYDLRPANGLQLMIDGRPWQGSHYLGRGLYRLEADWAGGPVAGRPILNWQPPGGKLEPVPAQVLFHLRTAPQGLMGSYFSTPDWTGTPVYQQITPFLLLAWPDKPPVPSGGAFSARFTGGLRIPEAGQYGFRIEADDGARLALDGQVIGEGLIPNKPNSFEAHLDLAAGTHPIEIDYVQLGGGSALRFLWSLGGGPWSPVPPSALVPTS